METLRVIIRPVQLGGQRVFLAQGLEKNIAVHGPTPQAAELAFLDHLAQTEALVQDHGARDPFEYLGEGPPEAWQAWDDSFAYPGAPTDLHSRRVRVFPALLALAGC